MAIHSFLKAEKGDPDWQFSPEMYFGQEFKLIDASTIELAEKNTNFMVLRQTPTEKDLLAKHIKIEVKQDAKLDLIIVNESDNKLQQIFLYDIHVFDNAGINLGIFVKNGKFNKHIIQVYLENNAEFNNYGLILNDVGGDTEVITKIVHQNNATSSNQFVMGMAGKESQTVYQAMTILDKGSEGSEANIEAINMIFGDKGRCYSKPDIYTDCEDVKSAHGCVTEYLNEEKIAYLQSKGFTIEKAKKIIVENFQNKVFDIIPYDDIKEEVKELFSN